MAGRGVFRRPWWQPPRPRAILEKSSSGLEAHSGGGGLTITPLRGGYGDKWGQSGGGLTATPGLGGIGAASGIEVSSPHLVYRGLASYVSYAVSFDMGGGSRWVVTDDIRAISIDRKLNTWPGGVEAGTADILIDDASGAYSPLRTDVHGGNFTPNRPVDIFATYTDPLTSAVSSFYLFRGLIDSIQMDPALQARTAVVQCRDHWKYLQHREVVTSMMVGWPVNSVLAACFDSASLATSQRSLDNIVDILPFAWFRNRVLSSVLDEFVAGAGYAAYVSANGVVRVRDRYFDIGGVAISSYEVMKGFTWDYDDTDIVNRMTAKGQPRTQVASTQVVARLDTAVTIAGSSSVEFFLDYFDPRNQEDAPAISMTVPVSSTDYLLNANSAGSGANYTSTASVSVYFFGDAAKVTIFNGQANTAYVTKFNLRGQPVVRGPALSLRYDVSSSQTFFGLRDETIESRLFTTKDLLERRALDVLELFAGPSPVGALTVVDDFPGGLALDLANVVSITNSHTGLYAEQFTIYGLSHDIRADDVGMVHQISMALHQSRALGAFILDTDQLDVDRIGR